MTTQSDLRPVPFAVNEEVRGVAKDQLNGWLINLVALALRLKQAHWNMRGARFKSVHEQLDEILVDVRAAVDDVAERVVTLGGIADGRPSTVGRSMTLGDFPGGRLSVDDAIRECCQDIAAVVQGGRDVRARLANSDPVSEDLVIGFLGKLEKHHWLLRSQDELA
ncbi:MAG: Dps family protein [Planctomycetota bacterium]